MFMEELVTSAPWKIVSPSFHCSSKKEEKKRYLYLLYNVIKFCPCASGSL